MTIGVPYRQPDSRSAGCQTRASHPPLLRTTLPGEQVDAEAHVARGRDAPDDILDVRSQAGVLVHDQDAHARRVRRVRLVPDERRLPVTGRDAYEFTAALTFAELRSLPDQLIKVLQQLPLLVDEQLRIAHHVDE